jgi:signal transduction histidine kinase
MVRVTPADMSLPAPIEKAVRFMVHEAIVNALQHAQPSRVSVDVQADGPDTLRIVVSDDGRGFPFRGRRGGAELTAANAGPVSLTERVDSLAGTLAISIADRFARRDHRSRVDPARVRLRESFLLRAQHELEAPIHAELLVDVVQVHLDRRLGNGQARRDRLVPETLGDHPHDFELTRRQDFGGFAR